MPIRSTDYRDYICSPLAFRICCFALKYIEINTRTRTIYYIENPNQNHSISKCFKLDFYVNGHKSSRWRPLRECFILSWLCSRHQWANIFWPFSTHSRLVSNKTRFNLSSFKQTRWSSPNGALTHKCKQIPRGLVENASYKKFCLNTFANLQ